MNQCTTSPGRDDLLSWKTGSIVLVTSGRRIRAKLTSVTVAVAPIRYSVSSSIPRIEPNRKLFSGTAEPAADRIKMPSAREIR